jgi:hypothetical protein
MTRSNARARQSHAAEDSSIDCEGICGDRGWAGLFIRGGLGGDVSAAVRVMVRYLLLSASIPFNRKISGSWLIFLN